MCRSFLFPGTFLFPGPCVGQKDTYQTFVTLNMLVSTEECCIQGKVLLPVLLDSHELCRVLLLAEAAWEVQIRVQSLGAF